MDRTGPEGKGKSTGRKLGWCKAKESDTSEILILGIGLGKKFHTQQRGFAGKGKRLRYFQDKHL